MKRLRLVNAGFVKPNSYFEPFDVEGYRFTSAHPKPAGWPEHSGSSGEHRVKDMRLKSCTSLSAWKS